MPPQALMEQIGDLRRLKPLTNQLNHRPAVKIAAIF